MGRWLARMGYSILAAEDGERGLEVARAERPDLIILDIFMPGPSGYQVLEEIRADRQIQSIPVIVVSVDDDRPRGLRSGATRSDEHTSELPSLMRISYAVFCLKKNTHKHTKTHPE